MFEYRKLPADVIKYLIIGAIIFGLVVVIPYNKLGVKDSIILAIILTLTVAIIENATLIITRDTATEKFDGNVVAPITSPETPPVQTPLSEQPSQPSQPVQPTQPTQPTQPPAQSVETSTQIQVNSSTAANVSTQNNANAISTSEISQKNEQPEQPSKVSKLYKNSPHGDEKEANGSREDDDVALSDLPYTDYHHIPLGDTYKPSEFEYGYSFLPPEKWYPTPPFPPVCVSEKRCPVCPVFTTGTPIDVKEWNTSRKVTQPAGINTKYIKDTLNAGR